MYDKTGEGWVKHILYGTSKILQLRGPEAHLIGPGRSFYLTARVFEICRSLIYSEPTFLWHSKWRSLMIEIKKQDLREALHPKEDLFDLMIQCSSLSCRFVCFLPFSPRSIHYLLCVEYGALSDPTPNIREYSNKKGSWNWLLRVSVSSLLLISGIPTSRNGLRNMTCWSKISRQSLRKFTFTVSQFTYLESSTTTLSLVILSLPQFHMRLFRVTST